MRTTWPLLLETGATSIARTQELASGIHVDYDADGKIVGLKLLDASTQLATLPVIVEKNAKTAA